MQVGSDSKVGLLAQSAKSTKADSGQVSGDSEISTGQPVTETVTISAEAQALLSAEVNVSDDGSAETQGNGSGTVPDLPEDEPEAETMGNGSGTVPDLSKSSTSSSTTPGNGSGTVPPDLNNP